jgi:hypothetical protein
MTLLKFGAIVTDGSGSLGGHTIQKSQGGSQLRSKPIPHGNPSASQILIRSINQQLQAGWRSLTPAQQKIWNDWPVAHDIFNAKGDKHPLSGHSLWMKYNYYWLIVGGGFLPDPSYWGGPIYGPELIKNGSFVNSANWIPGAGWTISGGKANFLDTIQSFLEQSLNFILNNTYRLEFDISNVITVARIYWYSSLGTNLFKNPYNSQIDYLNGHYLIYPVCNSASTILRILAYTSGSAFSLDNISLRKRL